jgi:hypothetical protein
MKINLVENTPAAMLLFEAFIDKPEHPNHIDFSNRQDAEIICTVNGLEVNIVKALEEAWVRADRQLQESADKRALEILEEIGFKEIESIRKIFEQAKYDIVEKIEKVTGKRLDLED